MADSEKQNKPRFRITEGILLALAPAFSYLLAFYYEKGFTQYFKIPTKFIQIGLIEVLILTSIGLTIVILFVVLLANFNLLFLNFRFEEIHPMIRPRLLAILPGVMIFVIFFSLFGQARWQYWITWLLVAIGIAAIYFVLPLFTQRKVSGYTNKLMAQEELDESNPGIYTIIGRRYGWGFILLVCFVILSTIIAQNAGLAEAVKQKDFLVLGTSPEMVVLRIYGDKMITAPFDRKTQEVQSRFVIKKVGEDDNLVISPEEIGPLKLRTPSPTPTPTLTPSPTATFTVTPVPTETPIP